MASSGNWKSYLDHAVISDVGMRRTNNQDSQAVMLASDDTTFRTRGHVFVVADGMGAHAAGELASKMATDSIPHNYHKLADLPPPNALRKSIREANAIIHRRGQTNAEFHGMGTTASCLTIVPQGALIAHVGDSRVYRLRKKVLEQLTFDHSLVWEMMASGSVPASGVANLVPKNIITRSLGPHAEVNVDLEGPFPIEVGDIFLLCSDGVSAGRVDDHEIATILASLPPKEAAQVIVDLANLRGGPDNITVIVVRITNEKLATLAKNNPEPLAIGEDVGEKKSRKNAAIFLWIVAAMFFIGCMVMFSVTELPWFLNLTPLVASVMFAFFGFQQLMSDDGPALKYLPAGRMLGKGPYRQYDCSAEKSLALDLARKSQELHEAAKREKWDRIDWNKFDAYIKEGSALLDRQDFGGAVREYGRAIRSMMGELRERRNKAKHDDSAVEL